MNIEREKKIRPLDYIDREAVFPVIHEMSVILSLKHCAKLQYLSLWVECASFSLSVGHGGGLHGLAQWWRQHGPLTFQLLGQRPCRLYGGPWPAGAGAHVPRRHLALDCNHRHHREHCGRGSGVRLHFLSGGSHDKVLPAGGSCCTRYLNISSETWEWPKLRTPQQPITTLKGNADTEEWMIIALTSCPCFWKTRDKYRIEYVYYVAHFTAAKGKNMKYCVHKFCWFYVNIITFLMKL